MMRHAHRRSCLSQNLRGQLRPCRPQNKLLPCRGPPKGPPQRLHVICMANERRVARVSKQIEREIGILLQRDQVLVNAVCPEHELGYDSSISAVASVSEVRLSSDLQVAKVYLSVYSDQEGKETALKGLSRLQGYVRTKLASQMQLRLVPEIRFIHDDAAERGEEVLRLLERIRQQDAGEVEPPPVAAGAGRFATPNYAAAAPAYAEDGFLDLGAEDGVAGFLDDVTDEAVDDASDDDDDEDLGVDRTDEVVADFLAGVTLELDVAVTEVSGITGLPQYKDDGEAGASFSAQGGGTGNRRRQQQRGSKKKRKVRGKRR